MSSPFQPGAESIGTTQKHGDDSGSVERVSGADFAPGSASAVTPERFVGSLDAIVVLGCMVRPNGEPSAALRRRLMLAVKAFRRQVASVVIVSGGRRWNGHAEAIVMKQVLEQEGVPETAIITELRSLSTLENSYYCAQLMDERAFGRVMIATCAWHMRRALSNFRYWGLDAVSPPLTWFEGPPASLALRFRERVSIWLDRGMAGPLQQRKVL